MKKKVKKSTKRISKKITKRKTTKSKSKIKRSNPIPRKERIENLKVKLKELKQEMKGDADRYPPSYGSTEWLIISSQITRLNNLIDDLNYTEDEEYDSFNKK